MYRQILPNNHPNLLVSSTHWHSDSILISRGCYDWRSSSLSRYCRKFRRMKNKIKLRALESRNLMPVSHTCLRASVWSKNKGEAAGPGGQSPGFATVLVCCINQLKLHLVRRCLPQTRVSETSAIPVKVPVIPVFFFYFKEKDTNLSYLFRESNMVIWCHCCESSYNLDLLNGYYSTLSLVIWKVWKQYNNKHKKAALELFHL